MMDGRLERVYARWCARSVLHLWDAPEVVRRWVDTGEEALREGARAAAEAACEAAWDAACGAAWDAARADAGAAARAAARASWAAAEAAEAAAEAAEAAAEAAEAAAEAAWAASWAAEEPAAGTKQAEVRALLEALPDLLCTHGLAARLLDDARAEPWLTREVVRALSLPDLAVWSDWCEQMTEVE